MQEKKVGDFYVTGEVLGKGAFSTVYTSYTRNRQKLAVKVIPRHNIRQNQLPYFQTQINLLRRCESEWMVDFIDVKKTKSNFYIFLEYCEGGNLQEYISKTQQKRLSEIEALRIFGQLVRGISCLRAMNIIHRDLKPANIMLKNGNIKIVDFGLARKFFNGELLKTYAGSPLNMAPQILKGEPYSEKVDIYSAGTILYEMLYGSCPYQADCKQKLIRNINRGILNSQQVVQISQGVVKILKGMLQPCPSQRIELSQLMDFVQSYEKKQQQERIKAYKKLACRYNKYCGVFGSIVTPFMGLKSEKMVDRINSPINLDLRIAGKYIQEISTY